MLQLKAWQWASVGRGHICSQFLKATRLKNWNTSEKNHGRPCLYVNQNSSSFSAHPSWSVRRISFAQENWVQDGKIRQVLKQALVGHSQKQERNFKQVTLAHLHPSFWAFKDMVLSLIPQLQVVEYYFIVFYFILILFWLFLMAARTVGFFFT